MAATRCAHCDTALTEAEATGGMCPECGDPIAGGLPPMADPVVPIATPVRGRWLAFPAGLVAGALLALSAAAAWWTWGSPLRAAHAAAAAPSDGGGSVAAGERARRVQATARTALEAAVEAEERRAAAEDELAEAEALAEVAEGRVAALQRAAAEAEARTRSAQASAADVRDAEDKARKARVAAQQSEAQRAAAERAIADARNRLQAVLAQQADVDRQMVAVQGRVQAAKGKEDLARRAEAEAQRARQTAERQLAEARTRLQAAQIQADTLDKTLAERKAKLADRDRALEAKKAQLADLDRAIEAKKSQGTVAGTKPGAFVRDWLVIGPFADPDRKGHATAFPPEAEAVDQATEYKGIGSLLRWHPQTSPKDYIDLAGLFRIQDPAVGYAVCWVRPDRARPAQLSLGSNDGIKVWVNGKLVADRAVSRSASPGQDKAACEFAAGWNEIRVKVDNTGGPWGFYLEVREPGGERPFSGLEFRTAPPDSKPKK
jgi:hypothetical protein